MSRWWHSRPAPRRCVALSLISTGLPTGMFGSFAVHTTSISHPSTSMMVNQNLDVLVWNRRAEDLWGLRAHEVQERSLLNLDIGLPVSELRDVIRPCLSGDSDHQQVVLDSINRRGKKIQCRVTCSPLVTPSKKRDGVILLMEEESA